MDAKEAIWNLKDLKNDNQKLAKYRGDIATILKYDRYNNAIDIALSALAKVETLEAENARLREKETPKEPRYVKEGDAYCPICGDSVNAWLGDEFISDEFISYKFCSNCGQAIKNDKE